MFTFVKVATNLKRNHYSASNIFICYFHCRQRHQVLLLSNAGNYSYEIYYTLEATCLTLLRRLTLKLSKLLNSCSELLHFCPVSWARTWLTIVQHMLFNADLNAACQAQSSGLSCLWWSYWQDYHSHFFIFYRSWDKQLRCQKFKHSLVMMTKLFWCLDLNLCCTGSTVYCFYCFPGSNICCWW